MPAMFPAAQGKLFAYQLPFSCAINFNGQKLAVREGLILQLQDNNKQLSYGEIAPLPGFSGESLQQAKAQIISLLNAGVENLQPDSRLYPSVNFALQCALQNIPVNTKIKRLDPVPLLQGNNASVIRQYRALHCPSLIKLKVARQKVQEDLRLFTELSRLNPGVLIRCDANRAWSATEAGYFFGQVNSSHLDYIEEPTANHPDNIRLAEKYQINLALDETLHDINFNYQHHACIKALILKPTLIGALTRLQSYIELAGQQQLQVHISSAFESIIGIRQLSALANLYRKRCVLSLGIDTLKYFQPGLLTDIRQLEPDLQKLECIWSSN